MKSFLSAAWRIALCAASLLACPAYAGSGLLVTQAQAVAAYPIWPVSTVPATPSASDPTPVEVGVVFSSKVEGTVTALRFYKGAGNTGTHLGKLWSPDGRLLASVRFRNESAQGWQVVALPSPVAIAPNQRYTVSYNAPRGFYPADPHVFSNGRTVSRRNLTAFAGVYTYAVGQRPVQQYRGMNYYVDLRFREKTVRPPEDYVHEAGQPWAHAFAEKPGLLTPESALMPYAGPTRFDSGEHRIENALITESLYLPAGSTATVTLRNVKFQAAGWRQIDARSGRIVIEHSLLDGIHNSNENAIITGDGDAVIRYNEFINFANPIRIGDGDLVEYNLLHRFPETTTEGNAHSDGIEVYASPDAARQTVIRGNFIDVGNASWAGHGPGEGQTGQINVTADFGWVRNVLIEDNTLLPGGTYSLYFRGDGYCDCGDIQGVTVRNNRLFGSATSIYGGFYGSHSMVQATDFTWLGNTFRRASDGVVGPWRVDWIWPGSPDDPAWLD